jgi:hypothetical protein
VNQWFFKGKKGDEYSHLRIQRLELEKYQHGYVFSFRLAKDFTCGDYLNWIKVSVKEDRCIGSRGDELDDRANSGMSSCGEKHVKLARK